MKNLLILFGVLLIFGGCQQANPPQQEESAAAIAVSLEEEAEEALVINLTSDVYEDAHPSLMAINFATKAVENGMDVTIFMNVHGVKLASSEASQVAFNSENLHAKLGVFVEKGGTVLACPMCMKIHGVDENSLAEGIQVSGAGVMMDKIKNSPTVFTY